MISQNSVIARGDEGQEDLRLWRNSLAKTNENCSLHPTFSHLHFAA